MSPRTRKPRRQTQQRRRIRSDAVRSLVVAALVLAGAALLLMALPGDERGDPDAGLLGRRASEGGPAVAARAVGRLGCRELTECSGLVAGGRNPRVLWVHNDSGGDPRLYAIGRDGECLARVEVTGAKADDWEDIARGAGPERDRPYLYIADTGNNGLDRATLEIYRVPEPTFPPDRVGEIRMASEPATSIPFRYEGRREDCEALVIHPHDGHGYLITKRAGDANVYRLESLTTAGGPAGNRPLVARRVATLARTAAVTGADVSAAGDRLAIRTYMMVAEYAIDAQQPFEGKDPPRRLRTVYHIEPQSEAVCYTEDGSILTTSEGIGARIYEITPHEGTAERADGGG